MSRRSPPWPARASPTPTSCCAPSAGRTRSRELRAYLDLSEDEGNAWGRLAEALTALGRVDEAADAYLAGIDQSLRHGHTGMATDFEAALEAL